MKIIPLVPRGYCKGVLKAIQIAKNTAILYPEEKIYVLGPIVHNHFVSQALQTFNIITLDDTGKTRVELLDEIDSGVVIFSAHGVNDKVIEKAKAKNLIIVDASCSDVKIIKDKVNQHIADGYDVLYIGKKNHPESEGVCYQNNHVICIETIDDIPLNLTNKNFYCTTQTTMSQAQSKIITDKIKVIYPYCEFEPLICFATTSRQNAIINMDKQIDGVIVVGDPKSNNTTKLANLAKQPQVKVVVKINSIDELDPTLFKDCQAVGITSGASTPNLITNMIIDYMQQYAQGNIVEKPQVDIHHLL